MNWKLGAWLGPAAFAVLGAAPCAAESRSNLPGAAAGAAPSPSRADVPEADLGRRLAERVARPGGLTAAMVARRAARTSPDERARAADVDAADADVTRANLDYYPRLTLTGRYMRLSPLTPPEIRIAPGAPGFSFPAILDQYLAQANVTVPLSDYLLRVGQSRAAAVATREAAEASRVVATRAVMAQAKLAYYVWARARLGETVTAQSVAQARHHLEFSRAARDAGRAPVADVRRAESLVAAAELADVRMTNAAALAEDRLRTLMHEPDHGRYEIGENLLSDLDQAEAGAATTLYREALILRPELRAIERTGSALESQREALNSRALPRLDAFGNAYLANPSPRVVPQSDEWRRTWDVGVQVTWSPNELGGADSAKRALDAKRRKLDAERDSLADSVRDEIAGAVSAWREARTSAETAARGLTAAEEGYRVRRELFELGRGTSVELIDAESDVLRARLEMIQARVDARVAKVRLEHAVGRDPAGNR